MLAAGVAALLAAPSAAIASPSPSPALDSVLAAPAASDYIQYSKAFMTVQGDFNVLEYVSFLAPADPSGTQTTLKHDGFVTGFGRSWVQHGSGHVLLEVVIAFSGGTGAKSWLNTSEAEYRSDRYYSKTVAVSGLDQYFGGHFADPVTPAYVDIVVFVKGNDYFMIGMLSQADDLADAAPAQTRKQYDLAPASTIPPAQWPENATSAINRFSLLPPGLAIDILVLALVAGIALFVVILIRRVGRRVSVPAYAAVPGGVQMSPDGHYWWDGQAWRDASSGAPPAALRSADGYYWWDGRTWRPVPKPTPD